MRELEEIVLTHGEVNVEIELNKKTIVSSYGSQDCQQSMFVTMVDCFDDITLEVTAHLNGGLRPEWEFNSAKLFTPGLEGGDLEDKVEMARELVDNHGLLLGLTEAFYR